MRMRRRVILAAAAVLILAACTRADPTGSVTSVTINGGDQTIAVGDPLTLTATVATTGTASTAVTWQSSDQTVATIDGAGVVTSLAAGTTDITATSTADPTKSDAITLTVTEPAATTFGEADVAQTFIGFGDGFEGMAAELEQEHAAAALAAFPGFTMFPVAVAGADGSLSLQLRPSTMEPLPRGIYEYDAEIFDWVLVEASEDLEYRWAFEDPDGVERDASLLVDWVETEFVVDRFSHVVEAPTAMNATLSVDAVQVGSVDAEFDWYAAEGCLNGVLEPTRVYVDGSLGTDATLSLNDVTVTLIGNVIGSSGDVVAPSGDQRAGFGWDVTVAGTLERVDCFIDAFEPTSGSIGLTVFRESAGVVSSVGFAGSFDDIVRDDDTGMWISVDIDGSIAIDGAVAVTFSGTLDDEDADGIPGENVTLAFSNGESTTLAAFIEEHVMATATAVVRVAALFR
jgi:hypothetical protein